MKSFVIDENDAGRRVDKFVSKAAAGLSPSLVYKYIRKKAVKVNGKRTDPSYRLNQNDLVEMYINDEFFVKKDSDFLNIGYDPRLDILYEDENLMLVDKRAGVLVHGDASEKRDTLINQVLLYLYNKGEYLPEKENGFTPSLCNRLDKNTGGIVIVAKNARSQRLLYEIVKRREVKKLYLALVWGELEKDEDTIFAYLRKNSETNTVEVKDVEFENSRRIITKYRVLKRARGMSLVEIDLVTGRTHQIRAHMAHIGHPIVGDGKYGRIDKSLPFTHQALYARSLEFCIKDENSPLAYLNGRRFSVKKVYFSDFLDQK